MRRRLKPPKPPRPPAPPGMPNSESEVHLQEFDHPVVNRLFERWLREKAKITILGYLAQDAKTRETLKEFFVYELSEGKYP